MLALRNWIFCGFRVLPTVDACCCCLVRLCCMYCMWVHGTVRPTAHVHIPHTTYHISSRPPLDGKSHCLTHHKEQDNYSYGKYNSTTCTTDTSVMGCAVLCSGRWMWSRTRTQIMGHVLSLHMFAMICVCTLPMSRTMAYSHV